MTYRGIYLDGIVLLEGDVGLKNGETVDVNPATARKSKIKGKAGAKARKSTKAIATKRLAELLPLPGFGSWKHRKDTNSDEPPRRPRRRTGTRRPRG